MSILRLDFLSGVSSLDPFPTNLVGIDYVQLQNGIYDHFTVTSNIDEEFSTEIPDGWESGYIMNCDFDYNIDAGSIDFDLPSTTSILIKRRKIEGFDWISLYNQPINEPSDIVFSIFDSYNEYGQDYEYALVPVSGTTEGGYIPNSIYSEFDGNFITDGVSMYKITAEIKIDNLAQNQKISTLNPLGSVYPKVSKNALANYKSGTISAFISTNNSQTIDRKANKEYREGFIKFLTNGKAKIFKDWNGNMWLVSLSLSPTFKPIPEIGNSLGMVSFEFVEIGDCYNQRDLEQNKLIDLGG
jgi:hypothetical protein